MRPSLPFVGLICSVESLFVKSVGSLLQPATFTRVSCLSSTGFCLVLCGFDNLNHCMGSSSLPLTHRSRHFQKMS